MDNKMYKAEQFQSSIMKNIAKDVQKMYPQKRDKIRSHIIFQGDPAFHQDSVQFVPMTRRKKIFEGKDNNILPPDLFLNNQVLMGHNEQLQRQRSINSRILHSFDRQFVPGTHNELGQQQIRRKKKLETQHEQTYFQANNLESDLNFGLIPHSRQDYNQAISMSKVSEQTQKKGGLAFQSNTPYSSHITSPHLGLNNRAVQNLTYPASKVNFSYQSKPPKFEDEVKQSRIQNKIQRKQVVPSKSRTKSIFVNQGGVMRGKNNKKVQIRNQNFFELNSEQNNDMTAQKGNKPGSKGFRSLQDNPDQMRWVKTTNEDNKYLINDRNNSIVYNTANNESIVSYKSIPRMMDNQFFGTSGVIKSKIQYPNQQKWVNQQNKSSVVGGEGSNFEQRQSLIMQISEDAIEKEQKKLKQLNSMNLDHQDGPSLFDRILKQRQDIFSKAKVKQQSGKGRVSERQNSNVRFTAANSKKQISINDHESVYKPSDFIPDFDNAPKTGKKSIIINNLDEEDFHQTHNDSQNQQNVMVKSRTKRVQIIQGENNKKGTSHILNEEVQELHAIQEKNRRKVSQRKSRQVDSQTRNRSSRFKNSKEMINQSDEQGQDLESPQESNVFLKCDDQSDHIQPSDQHSQDSDNIQTYKKSKKSRSKQRKTTAQNDDELQQFLKKQQKRIHIKQVKKVIQGNPQIQKVLIQKIGIVKGKNSKNEKHKQIGIQKQANQPVVYTNMQLLTAQQKLILTQAGIKLIQKGMAYGPQSVNQGNIHNLTQNHKAVGNFNNYFNSHNEFLQKQEDINSKIYSAFTQSQPENNTFNNQTYEQNPQQFQSRFHLITRTIYDQLNKFLTYGLKRPQDINQRQHVHNLHNSHQMHQNLNRNALTIQNIAKLATNNCQIINPQPHYEHNEQKQFGSTVSFKNMNGSSPQTYHDPTHRTMAVNSQHAENQGHQGIKKNSFSEQHSNKSLYNSKLQKQLQKFNYRSDLNVPSKQRYQTSYRQDSPNDQTHYYSFYHDRDDSTVNNQSFLSYNQGPQGPYAAQTRHPYPKKHNYRSQRLHTAQSYYPHPKRQSQRPQLLHAKSQYPYPIIEQVNQEAKQSRATSPKTNTLQNRQLRLLYDKIQLLTRQVHQQLPMIHREVQQNQKQIRKIQTNLLIKNTAQQHKYIQMLQKMKLKDLQLKERQKQAYFRDMQLSLSHNQLENYKNQLSLSDINLKDMQMHDFYQNRLQRIKVYNQKLCVKVTKDKAQQRYLI